MTSKPAQEDVFGSGVRSGEVKFSTGAIPLFMENKTKKQQPVIILNILSVQTPSRTPEVKPLQTS